MRASARDEGEVLVAILRDPADFQIACERHWYRIPIASVRKWLRKRWPPDWIAFYHPRIFGESAFSIHYYARVLDVRQVTRATLFPEEAAGPKSDIVYCQVVLDKLERLPRPIASRRRRRIVFIPTTWKKLIAAAEVNDLYDESPLEDLLYAEFTRIRMPVERQEYVKISDREYFLDFAVYCVNGELNIEADGDLWHANPGRAPLDNLRDNDLETAGWRLLRFNGAQVREEMAEYCLPTITQSVNNLGGIAEDGRAIPRRFQIADGGAYQADLFDEHY
jgi:very-short-patch-repair endonuclease